MSDGRLLEGLAELARPSGASDLAAAIDPLQGPDADRYLDLASENRLTASLVDALTQSGLEVPNELALMLADDQIARLQIKRTTEIVVDALGEHLPWMVIKGPAIAAAMSRPELRTYNDLDLLIPGRHYEEAVDRLIGAGIDEINENWEPYIRHQIGQLPMEGTMATVDVHWDPIALGWIRQSIKFDVTGMAERRVVTDVAGLGRLPVLEPVDQLLHLGTHCALSGAIRFDQFRDISPIADMVTGTDGWDRFTREAKTIGSARLIANALDRADQVVGLDLPSGLISELGGSTVGLRRSIDRVPIGLRRLPVDSWRRDPGTTGKALGRRLWQMVQAATGDKGSWDFAEPKGRLFYGRPSGGPDGRNRYMAAVRSWSN